MSSLTAIPALVAAFSLAASASCSSVCAEPARHHMGKHQPSNPPPDLPKACHATSCCTSTRKKNGSP